MAAAEEGGSLLFASLRTVEEEAVLGLENIVAVEEEGAVAVLVTTEEEGAVAALVDVEVWLGTPKSSVRRLLVRILVDMARGNFLLLGILSKNSLKKTLEKNQYSRSSDLDDAGYENAASALLYIHWSVKRFETGFDGFNG